MRLISYVKARYEDGSFTGVSRFDYELRRVFPEMLSVTKLPDDLSPQRDLVITDNHLSVNVPEDVKTIVVHHGCARTHYERDPQWRTPETQEIVEKQRLMLSLRNRVFVAPSLWVAEQFDEQNFGRSLYIPHHVDTFGPARAKQRPSGRPVVIGDWRNYNKGDGVVGKVAGKLKNLEFRKLNFPPDQEAREKFYLDADLYLCLSLSEGAPYAVADAEACSLRIVTTDVGFVRELKGATVIPWGKRDDPDVVVYHIKKALEKARTAPSFFERGFGEWASAWRNLVDSVWVYGKAPQQNQAPLLPAEPRAGKVEAKSVAVSLAGGIGNSIFNLPLLKALKTLGKEVVAYVGTDSPTEELWRNCIYIDKVVTEIGKLPKVDQRISGPWCAEGFKPDIRVKWEDPKIHNKSEWDLILGLASKFGWTGGRPDVSDWFRGLDAGAIKKDVDVMIVPGCKPEKLWERKRYPYIVQVAKQLFDIGLRVAWVGQESDRPEDAELPGEECFGTYELKELPGLFARARVVLGTDSGPTQLAASLGIPTVMLFTATSPIKGDPVGSRVRKLYRSLECSPCQSTQRWRKCDDWICREIDPQSVFFATMKMLDRT